MECIRACLPHRKRHKRASMRSSEEAEEAAIKKDIKRTFSFSIPAYKLFFNTQRVK